MPQGIVKPANQIVVHGEPFAGDESWRGCHGSKDAAWASGDF
jgi:hypothetical protein